MALRMEKPVNSPSRFILAFALAALAFLALDAVWLTTMASRLYRPAIGHMMREDFDVLAAAAFYAIYLAGLVVFVVLPAASPRGAAARGALFGLVAYATYDLTNQATIVGWPWRVTLADLCWGALATSCAAAFAAWGCRLRKR
jgi:uncharacterized membrane protein